MSSRNIYIYILSSCRKCSERFFSVFNFSVFRPFSGWSVDRFFSVFRYRFQTVFWNRFFPVFSWGRGWSCSTIWLHSLTPFASRLGLDPWPKAAKVTILSQTSLPPQASSSCGRTVFFFPFLDRFFSVFWTVFFPFPGPFFLRFLGHWHPPPPVTVFFPFPDQKMEKKWKS